MTHIETIKYMKSALDNALNSFEVPITAGIAEALTAANKAIAQAEQLEPVSKDPVATDSAKKDAVFEASIQFIKTLTGMEPPPIEIAPTEVFAPFREFTEKVCKVFAAPPNVEQEQPVSQVPVGKVLLHEGDVNAKGYLYNPLPEGTDIYTHPVRTKDLTDFGCVPNSNGTTNQRGELLSALEALLEDYIHRVQDAWIEAGGSDISREEVLTNCEPARNAAAAIANMTGATDELP